MPRRWTITTWVTGKQRDIDVVLYDRVSDLRRSASRFSRAVDEAPGSFNEAAGVCHGFQRFRVQDGDVTESPLVAIVRLARPLLTPTVLFHEMAHAAQHIYGLDYGTPDSDLSSHMHAGNEDFAYLLGEVTAAAWGVLEGGVIRG